MILKSTARLHMQKESAGIEFRPRARFGQEADVSIQTGPLHDPSLEDPPPDEYSSPDENDLTDQPSGDEFAYPPPVPMADDLDPEDYVILTSSMATDNFNGRLHNFAKLKIQAQMSSEVYRQMMDCVKQMATWFSEPANVEDLSKFPTDWRGHLRLLRNDIGYEPPETHYICMDQHHYHVTKTLIGRCPILTCNKPFSKTKVKRGQNNEIPGVEVPDLSLDPEAEVERDDDYEEGAEVEHITTRGRGNRKRAVVLRPAKHLMPFYYISMKSRIKRMIQNKHQAYKLLAHWRDRGHWIGKRDADGKSTHVQEPHNEIWDGEGFQNYSWLFDPKWKWLLPQLCGNCKQPINAELIKKGSPIPIAHENEMIDVPDETSPVNVKCPHCYHVVEVERQWTTGDPRNLALQFHADAFFPSTTSQKTNLDAMSITFLNMTKAQRCQSKNIFLCSFIRQTKADKIIHKSNPRFLEAFYKPLFDELEDMFINGLEVDYQYTDESLKNFDIHYEDGGVRNFQIQPGPMKIRVMLFNQAGDYKGLQQNCALKSLGVHPCRLCMSHSKYCLSIHWCRKYTENLPSNLSPERDQK